MMEPPPESILLLRAKMLSRDEMKLFAISCFVFSSGCESEGRNGSNILLTASAAISATSSSEYLKSSGI